jgi:hypothetical protein
MGYFACRAAPLGPVEPGVVEAAFYNFAPDMVRRALPDAWTFASPSALLDVRAGSAASALRDACTEVDVDEIARRLLPPLTAAARRGRAEGRALYAANLDVPEPEDRVAALWQACTTIREHRGDGHVAALTAAGISGLEAHVLLAADQGVGADLFRDSRGWTAMQWHEAEARLHERGLLTRAGTITDEGVAARAGVEATTDRLALALFDDLDDAARHRLLDELDLLAGAISSSGLIPYPNPMGLPACGGGAPAPSATPAAPA